jgi:hypothetical protein
VLLGTHAVSATLPGKTIDYAYDGKDVASPRLAWLGRAYVPPETAKAAGPVPLVVFLHGLNAALIKHRWMGGGSEGDVRAIVGDLVARGAVAPVVVAGPSSIVASEVTFGASWRHFALDNFLTRTSAALQGVVTIDTGRIVVAGHSGAGCSPAGGLETLGQSTARLLAVLSIDTCMTGSLAESLARSDPRTHVVVGYQTITWSNRGFDLFRQVFEREVANHPAAPGVLREIDRQRPAQAPHDATVALTLARWLPRILPPASPPAARVQP